MASLVKEEVEYLRQYNPQWLFIRDENFPLQKDWKDKLKTRGSLGANIYLFASANLLNDDTIKFMKDNNVYMTCLGLEDITVEYGKNKKLDQVCEKLEKNGIYKYLSFIVDPLKVNTDAKSDSFYAKLLERFNSLRPEMVCGNFLMPFRGTKIWDKYKHLVDFNDFKDYNSKSAFLEKDKERRLIDEFNTFKYQWIYYISDMCNKTIRNFASGDTLHLRFIELKNIFTKKIAEAIANQSYISKSEKIKNMKKTLSKKI